MNKKSLSGLSLVEIIVSLVILALVLSGFVNLFAVSKKFIIHNRSRMAAGELGRYFLDPLQMNVRQDTWDQAGNLLSVTPPYTGSNVSIDNMNFTPRFTITNINMGPSEVRKVTVTINWNESSP